MTSQRWRRSGGEVEERGREREREREKVEGEVESGG
jgi:hypothetical protein